MFPSEKRVQKMCQYLLRITKKKKCVQQNISLKIVTYNAKIWRPHLDLHISYGVYSPNTKAKEQAENRKSMLPTIREN